MSTDHQQLALKNAQPGMVLSDDVLDDRGTTLLAHGTTLTAPILASLARHGIETVAIRPSQSSSERNSEQTPEQERERLNYLFRKESCDEASSLLHQYVEHYRLGGSA